MFTRFPGANLVLTGKVAIKAITWRCPYPLRGAACWGVLRRLSRSAMIRTPLAAASGVELLPNFDPVTVAGHGGGLSNQGEWTRK